MSIWIPRSSINREIAEAILKKCTIIEELSDYDKIVRKVVPTRVQMFTKDPSGHYFIIPSFVAKYYGYQQMNNKWKQIVHPFQSPDGSIKYYPEFIGTFRDYQVEIIPEIIECLNRNKAVIIGLPPGWGKTIIAAYLIQMIGLMAFITFKQRKVYEGWKKTFAKVLPGMIVWCVGDEKIPEKFDIILCMNERIDKIPFSVKLQVGVVVYDETHTLCTQTQVGTFLGFQPKFIINETATLKATGLWRMATVCSGEEGVFRISKIPYNFYVIRTGVMGDEERSEKTGSLKPASVQKSLIENQKRKRIIQALIHNHVAYRKFICLQTVTKDIEENVVMMNKLGITADTLWGSKNTYNQSQVLFGTYGKISTGFDEENACDNYWVIPVKSDTMIFINSVASPWLLIQAMGRAMRTLDKIPAFFFLMDENKNVQNHLKSNKWLIELTNGRILDADYKTAFVPNPEKLISFSTHSSPGIYFKVIPSHVYNDFINGGFLAGDEEERERGLIVLQTNETVMKYKQILAPNTQCYLLTIHKVNLLINNGQIVNYNGLVYAIHTLFFSHVLSTSII
jgi:hypothetical protein